jgi:hypothetical protein
MQQLRRNLTLSPFKDYNVILPAGTVPPVPNPKKA